MRTLGAITVFVVAALHFGFLALQMFLWQEPVGLSVFELTPADAATMAVLAANQGLYNGFLAVGLLWGLFAQKRDVVMFFLLCVIAAGIYGAMTASFMILFVQAVPAIFALFLVILAGPRRQV